MSSFEEMDASELRAYLEEAHRRLVEQSREVCDALYADDLVRAGAVALAVKATCHQVDMLRRLLKVEVAG